MPVYFAHREQHPHPTAIITKTQEKITRYFCSGTGLSLNSSLKQRKPNSSVKYGISNKLSHDTSYAQKILKNIEMKQQQHTNSNKQK